MFIYAIKSIIFLSLMYIPYMLLLRKESFFRFNRMILLSIIVLSLALPFFDIHVLTWGENGLGEQLKGVIEVGELTLVDTGEYIVGKQTLDHDTGFNWWTILSCLYIIGVIVTIIVKLIQLILLNRDIHSGVLWTDIRDGVKIYCHIKDIAPFSWFNTIVISETDYNNNAKEILCHEFGHIEHYHSLDILLVNVLEIVQWCNPLSWILAGSLRDVHEYEADDAVLQSGVSAYQYQLLLIKKAVGSSSYAFANSFNHSLLKKRITMMLRKDSNPWMKSKALYILPVAAIALSAFATPELTKQFERITQDHTVNSDKVNETSKIKQVFVKVNGAVDSDIVENLIDNKATSIETNSTLTENIDASANVSEKVMQTVSDSTKIKPEEVLDEVEKMPEFPGGTLALMQYISQNIRYPKKAQEMGLMGRLIVQFEIHKDGGIHNIKPVELNKFRGHSASEIVDNILADTKKKWALENKVMTAEEEEGIREGYHAIIEEGVLVVRKMPSWTPGENKGKKVNVKFTIPISFRLQ